MSTMLGKVLFCGLLCVLLSQASLARPDASLYQHSTSVGLAVDNEKCQDNIAKIGNALKDLVNENAKSVLQLVENVGSLFVCFTKENAMSCAVNFFKAELDIIKLLLQSDLRNVEEVGSGVAGALATCIGGKMQFTSNLAFNAQIF